MIDDFPLVAPAKPLWLVTLADLALLLVGYLVLVNASHRVDRHALAQGFRQGFGARQALPPTPVQPPMPVAAALSPAFATGSATLVEAPAALIDWARAATRDPRVLLTVTGSFDGSAADTDAATGNGAILAADRARAVAATLVTAHAVAADRLAIATTTHAGRRDVVATIAFVGEQKRGS